MNFSVAIAHREDRIIGSRGEYGHRNPRTCQNPEKPTAWEKTAFNARSRRIARAVLSGVNFETTLDEVDGLAYWLDPETARYLGFHPHEGSERWGTVPAAGQNDEFLFYNPEQECSDPDCDGNGCFMI